MMLASSGIVQCPTIPDWPSNACRFSCLGCPARHPTANHEAEALVEHVHLLLVAVVNLGQQVHCQEHCETLIPETRRVSSKACEEQVRCEPLPEISAYAAPHIDSEPSAMIVNANEHAPPGIISDAGQNDLLRLLQTTQSLGKQQTLFEHLPDDEPLGPPVAPPPVMSKSSASNIIAAFGDKSPGRSHAQARTLPLPGLAEHLRAQAMDATETQARDDLEARARVAEAVAAQAAELGDPGQQQTIAGEFDKENQFTKTSALTSENQLQQAEHEEWSEVITVGQQTKRKDVHDSQTAMRCKRDDKERNEDNVAAELPSDRKEPPRPQDDPEEQNEEGFDQAQGLLNATTADLQQNRVSHSDAAAIFTQLIQTLPSRSRLRCGALLNRAHCYVGIGKLDAALDDISEIIGQGDSESTVLDVNRWHKVWMSRGGILRKLAQASGDPVLYAKARADYEHVLSIEPPHEEYTNKARRCLQQLDASRFHPASSRPQRTPEILPQVATSRHHPGTPPDKRRRLDGSPSRSASPRAVVDRSPSPARPPNTVSTSPSRASTQQPSVSPSRALHRSAVQRALEAFGDDCFSAGRALLMEGAVIAREPAGTPETAGASSATGLASGSVTTPMGPTSADGSRRVYEVRTPGGPSETVTLHMGTAAAGGSTGSSKHLAVPEPRAFASSFIGECSCRLRSHCKHVAAALCALATKDDREESPTFANTERASQTAGRDACEGSNLIAVGAGSGVPFDAAAYRRCDLLVRHLERKTNEELKTYLRLNNQLLSGTKPELAQRVAEGAVFGALPPCPRCGGHMHPEDPAQAPGTRYFCKRQNKDREPCRYEVEGHELDRKPFLGCGQLLSALQQL
eukprot:TRINITY_DN57772_c0_g1_i1.p1 TRINITY_DN57772_c0_g1~~TRINITY_DN57772_c0_g1_i1.p1  ORF type:complete len:857 (-),score=126.39 TRINITY_DN57772_c0_g1_i1:478-3048(-)